MTVDALDIAREPLRAADTSSCALSDLSGFEVTRDTTGIRQQTHVECFERPTDKDTGHSTGTAGKRSRSVH